MEEKKKQVDQAPLEVPQVTKMVREPQEIEPTLKVNVYKNYLPLCAVLVAGIGILMLYNKPVPATTQVVQPPQQTKPVIDPFDGWMDGYFIYRRSTLKGHIASNNFYII